mmetsp:Transcript_2046/g.6065  ORF Transcript_2046/g.6065 Transcript_2046/m.6065 type:complete len:303 (-) Transcript_2046:670-1578(-)
MAAPRSSLAVARGTRDLPSSRASSAGTTSLLTTASLTRCFSPARVTMPYQGATPSGASDSPPRRTCLLRLPSLSSTTASTELSLSATQARVLQASCACAASSRAIAITVSLAAARASGWEPLSRPEWWWPAMARAALTVSSTQPSSSTAAARSARDGRGWWAGMGSGPGETWGEEEPLRSEATARDWAACRTSSAAAVATCSRMWGGALPMASRSRRWRLKEATDACSPRAACSQASAAAESLSAERGGACRSTHEGPAVVRVASTGLPVSPSVNGRPTMALEENVCSSTQPRPSKVTLAFC